MLGRKKRIENKCNSILKDIVSTKEILNIYCMRVTDSLRKNDGNMMQVYNEISYAIANDYGIKNQEICQRVSLTLVSLIRAGSNTYDSLECKYHG